MLRAPRQRLAKLIDGALLTAASGLILLSLIRLTRLLGSEISARTDLPQWDMAKYALDSIHLADACRQLDPTSFLRHLHGMSVWPPLFPLLQAPAFLLFGYDYAIPRILVLALFSVLVGAVLWAGQAMDSRDGLAIGLLAAACLVASPLYQVFASLVMLEVPGALLLLLCLGAYWRADPHTSSPAWHVTCALSAALFFCKYNYGVMWLLPLGLCELGNRTALREGLRKRTLELWRRRGSLGWRRPWSLLLLSWTAIILIIHLTGGIDFRLGELRIRATSIGNPLYILWLLILIRWLLKPRRTWHRGRAWWGELDPRDRAFVAWVVLPIALWMLFPPHVKDFVGFLENRSSGRSLLDPTTWLYYPHCLVERYTPLWLAAGTGMLAVLGLGALAGPWSQALPRIGWRQRSLFLTLGIGWLAISFHPYKLPRFLFTSVPLVWLASGVFLALAIRALCARLSCPPRYTKVLVSLASGIVICAVLTSGPDPNRLRRELEERGVPSSVTPVLDQIAHWSTTSGRIRTSETAVLGSWNLLSPPLIEWHLRALLANSTREVPSELALTRQLARRHSPDLLKKELFEAKGSVRQLILIEPLPEAPWRDAFLVETAWLEPLRQALSTTPSFSLFADRSFPAAGYRLRLYVRSLEQTSAGRTL